MKFHPSNFVLAESPLAVILAQFNLREPIVESAIDPIRSCLRAMDLNRLTQKRERKITVTPGSLGASVEDRQTWLVLNSDSTKGVSLAKNEVAYFSGTHSRFDDFIESLSAIISCISNSGPPFEATSIALRYVNVFEIGSDPTAVVKASLGGLDRTNLGRDHHHHNYEFWCVTQNGRLHLRFSTTHGDQKPKELGHAETVFPARCLRSYDETVGHLDIFETTTNLRETADWDAANSILRSMNLNIEQAFLNAIQERALVDRFRASVKQS